MFLPFLVVTTAKIVQAHVGIKGLIEALDNNRPAREVGPTACARAQACSLSGMNERPWSITINKQRHACPIPSSRSTHLYTS